MNIDHYGISIQLKSKERIPITNQERLSEICNKYFYDNVNGYPIISVFINSEIMFQVAGGYPSRLKFFPRNKNALILNETTVACDKNNEGAPMFGTMVIWYLKQLLHSRFDLNELEHYIKI